MNERVRGHAGVGGKPRPDRILIAADANSAHTIRWVGALAARGYELGLFTLVDPQDCDYSQFKGVTVYSAGIARDLVRGAEGALRKLRYLAAVPALRKCANEFEPQLVHAHYLSSYGLLCAFAGLKPLVISVWGSDVFSLPARVPLVRPVLRAALGRADHVLSTSRVMREQTARLTRNAIDVIPFGIDVSRFCPESNPARHDDPVLTIGAVKALERTYGMDLLIDAFARVQGRLPDQSLRLRLVGGGSLDGALREDCRRRGIDQLVTFTGPIPYDQIHLQHQMLDIAAYPSRAESFGVAAVESQACGVPTVVANVGGLPEVVDAERTGLIVQPEDPEALANALERLIRAPDARRLMGAHARTHIVHNFAIGACVDRLEAIYTSVMTKYCRAR